VRCLPAYRPIGTIECRDDLDSRLSFAASRRGSSRFLGSFGDSSMTISLIVLQPLVALIAGLLILLIPRVVHVIVGIYLVAIGALGLLPHFVR
jgi:hypothetical protein